MASRSEALTVIIIPAVATATAPSTQHSDSTAARRFRFSVPAVAPLIRSLSLAVFKGPLHARCCFRTIFSSIPTRKCISDSKDKATWSSYTTCSKRIAAKSRLPLAVALAAAGLSRSHSLTESRRVGFALLSL